MKVEEYDIGNSVRCDFCAENYTNSDAVGGLQFESKAACPKCAPRIEADAKRYSEERFIRAYAEPGETFRDFTLRIRGGNNTVRITTLGKDEAFADLIKLWRDRDR